LFLLKTVNAPLWLALPAGGLASGLLAFLLGKAILRLRGAYFALATIGVNEAMRAFIVNFPPFGGPVGISLNFNIYKQYGGAANALWLVYYLLLALTLLAVVASYAIKNSKFGLSLFAIREDEDAAEVMGVITPNAKTWAYVLSAFVPGIVGVLFYFKNGNIEPGDAFRLHFSIELLVMVMLGGFGTVTGPVLGAAGYQRLRGILLTTPVLKDIQLVVAGVLLLIIILFIPAGAVGWLRNRFPRLRRLLP
jgi:branched-chain amino acid transport system permease protein